MNKKYQQVLLHVLGCLAFLSLPVIFSPDFSGSFYFLKVPFFQKDVVNYIVLILCFYFNFYLLIPKFYFNRKYFLFVLGILLSFAALIYVPEFIFKEFLFWNIAIFYSDAKISKLRFSCVTFVTFVVVSMK